MAIATALAIGGIASLAGGIGNYLANKSASERAELLQNQALQQWMQVNIPDPAEQKLALQQFVVEGKLNPKLEQSIKADPSAFKDVVTDVSQKSAQNRALSSLEKEGYEGGLNLQDKATLQDAMLNTQAKARGDRMAIASDMDRRGLGGSGFEVAAQLQGQQGIADQDAKSSLDVAAKAQDRALQSIQSAGDMATKYRTQDFSEQAQKAAAQDKINQFNTQNMQDVQQRNNTALNQAAAQNLAEQQRVSDQNVKQSNYEQEYNKKLLQQQFDDQAKKAAGVSGQYGALANNATQQGQSLGNLYSNMAQGVSGAATSAAQNDFWDKYFKKNATSGGT